MVAPPARADHTSVQATATGQVSATDNLFAAGGDGDRQADTFLTVRPGIIYAIDSPQMSHDLMLEGEATEYLVHNDSPSFGGRAGWTGLFLPGPQTSLTLSAGASSGVTTTLSTLSSADQTTSTVAPSGKATLYNLNAGEHLSWTAGEFTQVSESLNATYGLTNAGSGGSSDTREIDANLGLGRTFQRDSVALDAGASALQLQHGTTGSSTMPGMPGTPNGTDRQLNPRGSVAWHHDFNREWAASANGGVTIIHPLDSTTTNSLGMKVDTKTVAFTVYGAQVGYTELWGHASLSASRSVAPNLFLAQNTVDENINASVAMPLPWLDDTRRNPKLSGAGSIGVSRTQVLDAATSATQSKFDLVHLDLAVTYNRTPSQAYGVRYELAYQSGDSAAKMAIPSYYRNTLYFTFGLHYPDRAEGELRRHNKLSRSAGPGARPLGLEPVVPETVDPEPIDLPDVDQN
ncbi:MAG TPA: hypothetical protein VF469_26465 [Kofleriaceae bacterium]